MKLLTYISKLKAIQTRGKICSKYYLKFIEFITQSYFSVPDIVNLTLRTTLVRRLQTNNSFNELQLIIHLILNLKTL